MRISIYYPTKNLDILISFMKSTSFLEGFEFPSY